MRETSGVPSMPPMPSPLPPSLWSDTARRVGAVIAMFAIGAIGFGLGYLAFGGNDDSGGGTVIVTGDGAAVGGFPDLATRNTTRIGGADPTEDAASVALASYPSQGGIGQPAAVTVVPADNWQLSLAASPLTADPISAPILLSGPEVPASTEAALDALSPTGLDKADGTQAFVVGDVAVPGGLKAKSTSGTDPADVADQIDQERAKITGEKDPAHLLVVSSSEAALAMPAAAWTARSGDPVLFADGDTVPQGTTAVIKRHPKTPVFVLGPETAISNKALKKLGNATRVGAEDPVENAIEFAKFTSGDFGWNINDPGHGFIIASTDRPLDAAGSSSLASTGGTPGPLLVTNDPATVPPALQSFLSDIQPGFEDDPTRAVFNQVWIIGNPEAISVPFQVQVDQLTQLAPVSDTAAAPEFALPEGGGGGSTPELDPGSIDPGALGDLGGATPETTTSPDEAGGGEAGGNGDGGKGGGR